MSQWWALPLLQQTILLFFQKEMATMPYTTFIIPKKNLFRFFNSKEQVLAFPIPAMKTA